MCSAYRWSFWRGPGARKEGGLILYCSVESGNREESSHGSAASGIVVSTILLWRRNIIYCVVYPATIKSARTLYGAGSTFLGWRLRIVGVVYSKPAQELAQQFTSHDHRRPSAYLEVLTEDIP